MLAVATYEYSTGTEVISIVITAHLLFEFPLTILQFLIDQYSSPSSAKLK